MKPRCTTSQQQLPAGVPHLIDDSVSSRSCPMTRSCNRDLSGTPDIQLKTNMGLGSRPRAKKCWQKGYDRCWCPSATRIQRELEDQLSDRSVLDADGRQHRFWTSSHRGGTGCEEARYIRASPSRRRCPTSPRWTRRGPAAGESLRGGCRLDGRAGVRPFGQGVDQPSAPARRGARRRCTGSSQGLGERRVRTARSRRAAPPSPLRGPAAVRRTAAALDGASTPAGRRRPRAPVRHRPTVSAARGACADQRPSSIARRRCAAPPGRGSISLPSARSAGAPPRRPPLHARPYPRTLVSTTGTAAGSDAATARAVYAHPVR